MIRSLRAESLRIHLDWWERCRSCEFWTGDRTEMEPGICNLARSELGGEITTAENACDQWESYDSEQAMAIRQAQEEEAAGDSQRMDLIRQIAFDRPFLKCRFCGSSNAHNLQECQECGKKWWNDPDDTQMGRALGQSAREDPDVARAQSRYEDGVDKLRAEASKSFGNAKRTDD